MKTLTTEERANWEYLISVDGGAYTFYMEEANMLPLYLVDNNGVPTAVDLEEVVEDGGYTLQELLDDNNYYIEDNYIFNKDNLEEIGSIPTYYGCSDMVDSYTNFYKIDDGLYAVNPANSDEYYIWEDVEQMVHDNTSASEVWHYGGDELKKIYFGDDLDSIVTVVACTDKDGDYIEDDFIIMDRFSLKEHNPAYNFGMLGRTKDGKIIYYSINNCNVTQADMPSGYEIDRDVLTNYLESLKRWDEVEHEDCVFEDEKSLKKELLKFGFKDSVVVGEYVNSWMDGDGFVQETCRADFEVAEYYPDIDKEDVDAVIDFFKKYKTLEKKEKMIDTTYDVVENFDGFPEFEGFTYVSYKDDGSAEFEAEDATGGLDNFYTTRSDLILKFSNNIRIDEHIEEYFEIINAKEA